MSYLAASFATLMIGLLLPNAVAAVQVEIVYQFTGGTNTSAFLGGQAPTGGYAVVRWELTSLAGAPVLSATATALQVHVKAPGTAYSFSPFSGPIESFGGSYFSFQDSGPSSKVFQHSFGQNPSVGVFYTYTTPMSGRLTVTGKEVARTLPEPSRQPLLLAGLFGVAALAGLSSRIARWMT